MKHKWRIAVLLFAGVLAAVTGRWVGQAIFTTGTTHSELVPNPGIVVSNLDFGEIWQQDQFVWPIEITNTSSQPKTIRRIEGSCSCQSISPTSFTLQPGEKQKVEITINHKSKILSGLLPPVEDYEATFGANVDGDARPIYWKLYGRIKHALRYPAQIDLGKISELPTKNTRNTFAIYPLQKLQEVRILSDSPLLEVSIIPKGEGYEMTLMPIGNTKRMKHNASINIQAIDLNGVLLLPVQSRIAFEISSDIVAVPSVVNIGIRNIGERITETINLRSLSGNKFMVDSVSVVGSGLTVKQIEESNIIAYEVELHMDESIASRHITFVTTDETGAKSYVRVEILAEPLKLGSMP